MFPGGWAIWPVQLSTVSRPVTGPGSPESSFSWTSASFSFSTVAALFTSSSRDVAASVWPYRSTTMKLPKTVASSGTSTQQETLSLAGSGRVFPGREGSLP